ncbi:MAG: NAD-dependent epimerase/dehydratase family protein, partial [Firmicutes bacterium]|nr:NAD-dependent epimerase/dehydratase family protein [Bacillota bacterium]
MLIGITGGAGYIGARLAGILCGEGFRVRVLDDFSSSVPEGLHSIPVDLQEGDAAAPETAARFMQGLDFLFDLSGVAEVTVSEANPGRCLRSNILARHTLVGAVPASLTGWLFPSSVSAVYGKPLFSPLNEWHPPQPSNLYGVSKLAAEQVLLAAYRGRKVPVVILRQSNVYGPSPSLKFDSVIPAFIRQALTAGRLTVHGNGLQVRSFVHIEDLLDVYLKIMKLCLHGGTQASPAVIGRIYNIGGEESSIRELGALVAEAVESRTGKRIRIEIEAGRPGGVPEALNLSLHRIHQALGYRPTRRLRQAVAELVELVAATSTS